jgi:predicted branched-subunit amino acid permease
VSEPVTSAQRGSPSRGAVRKQSLAVGVATGLYGISFGALSVAAGLTLWQTVALSALMFTGGSQFAYVGVVGAGGGGPAAFVAATMLGARNGVYGLQLSATLRPRGWRRPLAAHLTLDESTAVSVAQREPESQRLGFWVTGVAVFCCWNLMTVAGAVLGDRLGDPSRYGLDAMAAAAFLALLWPRLTRSEPQAVAAGAVVVAIVCLPVVPAGVPVLLAALVALGVAAINRHRSAGPLGRARPVGSNVDPDVGEDGP